MFRIQTAVVGYVFLTSFMHIHVACLALQALSEEAVEKRAAVVAEREPFVVVDREPVRHVHVESLRDLWT